MNKGLISLALARRLDHVRSRVSSLDPHGFGEAGGFVSSAKEVLGAVQGTESLAAFSKPEKWVEADSDCLASLQGISLHSTKETAPAPSPPNVLKRTTFKSNRDESEFNLLEARYAWPLNFSVDSENEMRERYLKQLMVSDRSRVEHAATALEADELMLKLNLIAVHACTTSDLRFIDALNYYYELLPAALYPESQCAWLLVSWLVLYARALNSWS